MNIPDLLLKYLNITAAMREKVFRKINISSIIIVIPDPLTNCKLQNLNVLTAMRDKLFVKKCFSYHHCSDRRKIVCYQTWIWRQPCATRHRISLFKAFARSLRHLWKCRLCNDFHTNIKMIYKERVPVQVFHVLIVLVFHPIRNRHRARNCEFHLIIDSLQVMFPHKGGSRSTWIYVER